MVEKRNTFKKNERLCSKKIIAELFEKGSSGFIFPFRYVYFSPEQSENSPLNLLISVSKRYHKRANKRNENKRRIREAYRLNNHSLKSALKAKDTTLNLALIYSSKEMEDYKTIENAVRKIMLNLEQGL